MGWVVSWLVGEEEKGKEKTEHFSRFQIHFPSHDSSVF